MRRRWRSPGACVAALLLHGAMASQQTGAGSARDGRRHLLQSTACATALQPSVGPTTGGTTITLVGLPHLTASAVATCAFTPSYGTNATVPVTNGTCAAPVGLPGLSSSVVVSVAVPSATCLPSTLNFSYYPPPAMTLSLPPGGPRYGVVALTVFPSEAFFMRSLASSQQAQLACQLRHVATGVNVTFPGALALNGTAVACSTRWSGVPLLDGPHNVLLSFNGVDFHGAPASGANTSSVSPYTTYTAHGPLVSLGTTALGASSTTGADVAVAVTMTGTSTAPVAVTLALTGGGGGSFAPAIAAPQLSQLALYDYILLNATGPTVTWPPGASGTQALLLRVPNTTEQRSTTSLTLAFTAASVTGGDPNPSGNGSALLVITNSNPPPAFGVPLPAAAYAREAATIAVAPITGSSALQTRVTYALTNGTALAGIHFAPAAGVLTWQPRDVSPKLIPVTVFWNAILQTSALSLGVTLSADGLHGSVYNATATAAGPPLLVVPLNGSAPVLSLFGVPRATCPPGTAVVPPQPPQPSPPPAVFAPPAPPPPGHPAVPPAPPTPVLAYPVAPADTAACKYCLPGSFAAAANASICTLCAPGTYTPLTRALTCTQCAPGYFASSPGAVACRPCGTGTASVADNSRCAFCAGNVTTVVQGQATCTVPVVPFVLQNSTRASVVRFSLGFAPSAAAPPLGWAGAAGVAGSSPCSMLLAYTVADLAAAFSVLPGAVTFDLGALGCALGNSSSGATQQPVAVTVAVEALTPRDADVAGIAAAVADAKHRAAVGATALTLSLGATMNATQQALGVSVTLTQAPNTTVVAPPVAAPSRSPWEHLPLHLAPAAFVAAACAAAVGVALAAFALFRCLGAVVAARRAALAARLLTAKRFQDAGTGDGATVTRVVELLHTSGTMGRRLAEDYPTDADGLRMTVYRPEGSQVLASFVREAKTLADPQVAEWAARAQRNAVHARAIAAGYQKR